MSINKCIFVGNVGKAPEIRYMTNGEAVANFSIACNETWKDKNGEKQERTEWVNCVAYKRLAEIVGEYVTSGQLIYVEGKQQTRKWQDKNSGQDRYTTEIVVDKIEMLGGKGDKKQEQREEPKAKPAPAAAQPSPFDSFDETIPFSNPYQFNWRTV